MACDPELYRPERPSLFYDCMCQTCQQSHLDNSHCYQRSFPRSVREQTAHVSYSRPDPCFQPSRFPLCLRLSPSGLFEHWQYQAPSVQYSRGTDLWRGQQQQLNPTPGRTAAHLGGTPPCGTDICADSYPLTLTLRQRLSGHLLTLFGHQSASIVHSWHSVTPGLRDTC